MDINKLILKYLWKDKRPDNQHNTDQHNTEGEQSWRADTTRHQDLLQSSSNQNSTVLAKDETKK